MTYVNSRFGVDFPFESNFSPCRCRLILTFSSKLFKAPEFVHFIHQSCYFTIFDGCGMLVIFMFNMRIIRKTYGSIRTPVPPAYKCHRVMCFSFSTKGFSSLTAKIILTHSALEFLFPLQTDHTITCPIVILRHNDSTSTFREPTNIKENFEFIPLVSDCVTACKLETMCVFT